MTRVLVYTSPARGHLFPLLPTLLELAARGHAVEVRTLASECERVRGLGLAASPIAHDVEGRLLDDWKATGPIGALRRALGTFADRAVSEVADLERGLREHRPDVLLVDVNSWGAIAAAEASRRPFAVFSPYFLDLPLPGRPPFGLGLAPMAGLVGRVRDAVVRRVSRLLVRPYLARLNRQRSSLGLPPIARLGELPLRADAVLYLTAEPLEYSHGGWPEKVRFVGPGLWEPEGSPRPNDALPTSRPLVLVTCSTEQQDDGRLIELALEAMADEDVDVVATTAALDPARFRAPPNARVVRYAPHGPLLSRAAVVACHGGMGITQKALAAGVPVCVVPFGRDQLDVARHVEASDAGTWLAPRSLRVDRLRAAIRGARAKKAGAERVARAFAELDGPRLGADAILALVR